MIKKVNDNAASASERYYQDLEKSIKRLGRINKEINELMAKELSSDRQPDKTGSNSLKALMEIFEKKD